MAEGELAHKWWIIAKHSCRAQHAVPLRDLATAKRIGGVFVAAAFCGSVRKVKRAGETPALRKPGPAFAELRGAHRSRGRWGGVH
jgi:hypothetical protein